MQNINQAIRTHLVPSLKLIQIKDKPAKVIKQTVKKLKKLPVLVVEDVLFNQIAARMLLESKGYQVDIADTGEKALELYQANRYAAILMDMDLPDMKGTEVTQKIRAVEQKTKKHIPIIACTANGLSAKPECLAAGMDDFSCKPIDIEALSKVLNQKIGKSK